tara:strand:- start:4738 stop:4977 length:240 start_codon:yes stop_codon:yes gene_type:complete
MNDTELDEASKTILNLNTIEEHYNYLEKLHDELKSIPQSTKDEISDKLEKFLLEYSNISKEKYDKIVTSIVSTIESING